jgi:DEAD/DEAH box helicase domain-containing protein
MTSTTTGVQNAACKEGNLVCSKIGAHIILRGLLGMEVDADAIPMQCDAFGASETVVEADSIKLAKEDIVWETDDY